jgi:pSer/pThr/pTyr-binding forkhead associated (FHA) protein
MATAMNLTFLGAAAGPKAALEGAGSRWPLEAAVVSIGSDPKSDVALSDPHVSHVHAQITRHGDDMFLRDVGSRSGSFVNGQRLTLPHRLQNGDKLQFGQVQLTYVAG